MLVYFETHATSVDNEAGLASGHYDAPLSERDAPPALAPNLERAQPGPSLRGTPAAVR